MVTYILNLWQVKVRKEQIGKYNSKVIEIFQYLYTFYITLYFILFID